MVHEPTVKLMQEHYAKSGKDVNAARLRMATLPQGAEVSEKPEFPNRHSIVAVLQDCHQLFESMQQLTAICNDLNSYKTALSVMCLHLHKQCPHWLYSGSAECANFWDFFSTDLDMTNFAE